VQCRIREGLWVLKHPQYETTTKGINMPANRSVFFVLMAILVLILNLIGFHQSYFLQFLNPETSMSPVMHIHVALGFTLFILFIAQSYLAWKNRFATHKKLGPSVMTTSEARAC
jgi:cytochrome b561